MDPRIIMDPQSARFHAAIARVSKYDGKAHFGMCSNTEIARLEKLADQLEKRAEVSRVNEPMNRAVAILAGLQTRYHQARSEVLKWQAELHSHRQVLSILGTPLGYFQEPEAIKSMEPAVRTTEEYEAFSTKLGHTVADLEMKATTLRDCCHEWTRLTLEQQNRKLILALAERL